MKHSSKTVGTKQIYGEKCLAGWLAERLDFSPLIQMFWLRGSTGRVCQADLWSLSKGWYMSTEHYTSKWVHGTVVCEMRSRRLQPRRVTDLPVHFQVLLTGEPPICIHLITAHAETVIISTDNGDFSRNVFVFLMLSLQIVLLLRKEPIRHKYLCLDGCQIL